MDIFSYFILILMVVKSVVDSQLSNSINLKNDRTPLGDCYECGIYNSKQACIDNQKLKPCQGPNKVCQTINIYYQQKLPNGTKVISDENYGKSCETANPYGCDALCSHYRESGICKIQCCNYHACNQDVQFERAKPQVSESVGPALQYDSSASTVSATLFSTVIVLLHLV